MSVIRGVSAPNLPNAPKDYEQRYQDQFGNALKLFFGTVVSEINAPVGHASYFDTTTQTNPVANSVNLFTYNSIISQFQIQRGVPQSKIYVANTGLYNIHLSAQLDKVGGPASSVHFWVRLNGTNLPNSARKIVIDGPNNEMLPSLSYLLALKSGDYFELAWQSSDTDVIILAEASSGNVPETPSVILTVTYVSRLEP